MYIHTFSLDRYSYTDIVTDRVPWERGLRLWFGCRRFGWEVGRRVRVPGNLPCEGTRETRLVRGEAELQCKLLLRQFSEELWELGCPLHLSWLTQQGLVFIHSPQTSYWLWAIPKEGCILEQGGSPSDKAEDNFRERTLWEDKSHQHSHTWGSKSPPCPEVAIWVIASTDT